MAGGEGEVEDRPMTDHSWAPPSGPPTRPATRPSAVPPMPPPPVPPPPTPPPPGPPAPTTPATAAAVPFTFGSEVFLRTAGLGLVVLAVAFVVSTVFRRGWVGPELQLAAAVGVGGGLLALGRWLHARDPGWGNAVAAGGVLALAATAASRLFVDQLGVVTAQGTLAAVAAIGMWIAWHHRSAVITNATMLGVAVATFVVPGRLDAVGITAWAIGLVGAGISVALAAGLRSSRLAALGVGAVMVPIAAERVASGSPDALLIGAVGAVFAVGVLVLPALLDAAAGDTTATERHAVVATAPWLLVVGELLLDPADAALGVAAGTLAAVLLALAHAGAATLHPVHRRSIQLSAMMSAAIGAGLLLAGPSLLVVLALEVAGLGWLRRQGGDDGRLLGAIAVVGVPLALHLLVETTEAWVVDAPFAADLMIGAAAAILCIAAWLLGAAGARSAAIAGPGFGLLWLGAALVHLPQGQMLVSLSWAMLGLGLLAAGALTGRQPVLAGGVGVIVLTVGKLVTVDLAEVDTLWRAALFFVVGAAMVRMGYALPGLTRNVSATDTEAAPARSADEWPTTTS